MAGNFFTDEKSKKDFRVLISGSFDPITVGHFDLIARAAGKYNEVIVCIFVNPDKTPMFTLEQRREIIEECVKEFPNVKVDIDKGMLADYAKNNKIDYIVKGYRNEKDIGYELNMAKINEKNSQGVKTVLFKASKQFVNVSSTIVRDLILSGADYCPFVPAKACEVIDRILQKH